MLVCHSPARGVRLRDATTDRPQFQAMLAYCRAHGNEVTHVVLANLSRLARNVADQSATLATFKQLGIIPVSGDETIAESAAGKLSVNLPARSRKIKSPARERGQSVACLGRTEGIQFFP